MSCQHKVVRIVSNAADFQVYTVGSGSWRRVASDDQLKHMEKENGDEKSWRKEFQMYIGYCYHCHCPIKVFTDGDILMQLEGNTLLYYSKKYGRETIQQVDLFEYDHRNSPTTYTPSFLSLKTLAMENKNWNLFSVNIVMAGTGIYQLTRKIRHDYFSDNEPAVVSKE